MNEETNSIEKYNMRLLAKGDVKAFDTLFLMYSKRLFQFSFRYLKSKEEAEEIIQETFIRIWEKRSEVNATYSLGGFIFTIAHRLILNRLRKLHNEKRCHAFLESHDQRWRNTTEEILLGTELEDVARTAIEALPPKRQMIYRMVRVENMTYQQVADHLQISVKTVEAQMSEALKFLRSKIVVQGIIPLLAIFFANR